MNRRLYELCERIAQAELDAALVLHARDVLYYAGTARPASLLVVPPGGAVDARGGMARLFVRRGLPQVREEATVSDVVPMGGLSEMAQALVDVGLKEGILGIELDTTSAELRDRIAGAFADWALADVTPLILDQRTIKDESELSATRRAAAVADAGHRALSEVASAGLCELELVAEVERAMRLAGHEGYQPLRDPGARGGGMLLMSGENLMIRGGHGLVVTGAGLSAATPYGASSRMVDSGDLIVLDTGSTWHGYTADESRTYVIGHPTQVQEALFAVAANAEETVLGAIRPGMPMAELYGVAKRVVDQGAVPLFPSGSLRLPGFVGHGVGLELDEPPVLWGRQGGTLREGMVLAIEIEVTAPEKKMMAKMEDTVVVGSDGAELLTHRPRGLVACG